MAHHRRAHASRALKHRTRRSAQKEREDAAQTEKYRKPYDSFVKQSGTGLDETLHRLWNAISALRVPFLFDVDADMAKFTFANGSSAHICTSTRRFHRPGKTGKPRSVTIVLGGFKPEYDDPENLLIPCDRAGRIECCYFGMGDEEEDLAMFFIEQLIDLPRSGKTPADITQKARIIPRKIL